MGKITPKKPEQEHITEVVARNLLGIKEKDLSNEEVKSLIDHMRLIVKAEIDIIQAKEKVAELERTLC